MTILPKKKASQEKRGPESGENHQHHGHGHHSSSHSHGAHGHSGTGEARGGARPKSRNSPPRWPSSNPRDDRLVSVSSHDCRTSFDGHERLDAGGHGQNKRARHRSSPHRLDHQASVSWLQHRGKVDDDRREEGERNEESEEGGCNSGDEYDTQPFHSEEHERMFEKALKEKRSFIIKQMSPDGACLFRAVADQVYGDQEWHGIVRAHCMDYMTKNADYYSQYVTEDFATYVARKRMDDCHGNHVEMQALSEMYNRNIEVFVYSTEPINTFHTINKTDNEPIRVSYHRSIHYNSVVNPHKATIGVGLGMPSFVPGLADKSLLREALRHSENTELETAMLEDKLRATDWEATNDAIEEQIARESYMQWLRDNEERARKKMIQPASATCSSAPPDSPNWWEVPPTSGSSNNSHRSHHAAAHHHHNLPTGPGPNSPDRAEAGTRRSPLSPPSPKLAGPSLTDQEAGKLGSAKQRSASPLVAAGRNTPSPPAGPSGISPSACNVPLLQDIPPTEYGLSEWGTEDEILASVLAQSQQEYLDTLKQHHSSGNTDS
ncbi:OTU domain-containing protein 5-B-like [Patiria miniata]|uniref:ubiquitinyl hydrolase 1 n=1 Tax=Patiria miniata TaxID=46514 RepID=A0A914AWJ7_PATMI|nr:OTU domain-containing protein 5-B-like [Patiria miniata]